MLARLFLYTYLIKILNLNNQHIAAIYEQAKSNKIGNYAPGTNIPIVSDIGLKKINRKVPIINLAWHINKEIKTYLKKNFINNKIIDILTQQYQIHNTEMDFIQIVQVILLGLKNKALLMGVYFINIQQEELLLQLK